MAEHAPGRDGAAHPGAVDVSWEQALAWRMQRQYLLERAPAEDLIAIADRMCGLHAQLMSSVELALWARTEGLQREAVRDALWHQRTLVKLWAMGKTLRVFPSSDLGLWLTGLRTYRNGPEWYGLRDPHLLELADLIGSALHGRLLTRVELAAEVGRLSGSAAKEEAIHGSWGGDLKPASFLGRLCFGPSDGPRVRFTHPDTWLPSRPELGDEAQALTTIAERYLGAYAPASTLELGTWWGVGRRAATPILAALGDAVTKVHVEGEPYWIRTQDVAELAATKPSTGIVRLLPAFDQWVTNACRRDGGGSRPGPGQPALDPAFRTRVYRQQGWLSPIVLIDGRMEGIWKHQRRGRRVQVEVEAFNRLPRWSREPLEAETERLAAFLGAEPQLTIT